MEYLNTGGFFPLTLVDEKYFRWVYGTSPPRGPIIYDDWLLSKLVFAGQFVLPGFKQTYDKYAVGNLKAKYQIQLKPSSSMVHFTHYFDNNFPITTGIVSTAGRSLVIHRQDRFYDGE